jgi:hypothetical protein
MEELQWQGPDVEVKSLGDEGREMRALNQLQQQFCSSVCQADGTLNLPPEVRHRFHDLDRAYSLVAPIFAMARWPLGRRQANAAGYAELLARLTVAEISCFTAIARARGAWLFRALRDANPPEE